MLSSTFKGGSTADDSAAAFVDDLKMGAYKGYCKVQIQDKCLDRHASMANKSS